MAVNTTGDPAPQSRSERSRAAAPSIPLACIAVLLAGLIGCQSSPGEGGGDQGNQGNRGNRGNGGGQNGGGGRQAVGGRPAGVDGPAAELDPRLEVDFNIEWEDIDKDEQGIKDAEEVARWVTERRNKVQECLRNDPQALTQAVELLQEITTRVPDSSKDRYLLAECYFVDANYWWRMTDVTAWELNRIKTERTEHLSVDPKGSPMTDAEVDTRSRELQTYFDACLAQLEVSARRALATFTLYRQARPDDKRVYDYLWKLYFFVQEFREAKRWLELIIHEMDVADVPSRDPLRQNYQDLIEELKEKIAEERAGEYTPLRPMVRDRFNGRRPGAR